MTAASRARPSPGRQTRQSKRAQVRADRTRDLVIEETIKCIREEGFAAASTRHIVERAGVSWGVIQYHFGDRDGLLTAVIDYGFETLVESLNDIADTVGELTDARSKANTLAAAAWQIFGTPRAMGALEILIATRGMSGALGVKKFAGLQAALARIAGLIDDSTPHADSIATLLWAGPVGVMVAEMVMPRPLHAESGQDAMADLIADHLSVRAAPKSKRVRANSPKRRKGA
ncbi:MAG: hypothetical protein NVS4B6_03730 [Mycobacterium sp.]